MSEVERSQRPIVGLVTHGEFGPQGGGWWAGALDVTREHEANLIVLDVGLMWALDIPEMEMRAVLNQLIDATLFDALVLEQWWPSQQMFEETYDRYYAPLPVVNVQRTYEGWPGVIADNYAGTMAEMRHLLDVHGYRRIAFVRGPEGNPSAEGRYRAYVDALAEADIPLDPDLVLPGDFSRPSGEAAMRILIEARDAMPGEDVQAVVAANDWAALGALDALRARGVNVPGDVAVLGFDAVQASGLSSPPLTTVRMPNYEMGALATRMALALLAGDPMPEHATVPARLVVRRSCGCFSPPVIAANHTAPLAPPPDVAPFEAALAARRDETLAAMLEAAGITAEDSEATWAAPLLDAFAADVAAATEMFLPQLSTVLEQWDVPAAAGQAMLSALRRHVLPCVATGASVAARQARAEGLLGQARVLTQEMASLRRERELQRLQTSFTNTREAGETLITTFDVAELLDVLIEALSNWGVASCYLALYEDPETPAGQARLLLAYMEDGGRVDLGPEGRRFPAQQLVPPDLLPHNRSYTMLVEPLYFQKESLGFVVFECRPGQGESYASLSRQVSSALMGALLVRRQEQAQREAQVAQRQAQAALEELTRTRQITDRVRRAPDTEAILRVTLAELSRVLGASIGVARLGTQNELLETSEAEDV